MGHGRVARVVLHPGGAGQTTEDAWGRNCDVAGAAGVCWHTGVAFTRRPTLPTLVIRNVDATLHARLKDYAAAHGHSIDEEVRRILCDRLAVAPLGGGTGWVDAIRALVDPLGGIDLREVERETLRDLPDETGSRGPPRQGPTEVQSLEPQMKADKHGKGSAQGCSTLLGFAPLGQGEAEDSPEGRFGTDPFAFFAFICGSTFFASPRVSDNAQRADCPRGVASKEGFQPQMNAKNANGPGNLAGPERGTRFPGAGGLTRCLTHVQRQ